MAKRRAGTRKSPLRVSNARGTQRAARALSSLAGQAAFIEGGELHLFGIPGPVISRITTEPRMQRIPINFYLNAGYVVNGEVSWTVEIRYLENGRKDYAPTLQGRMSPGRVDRVAWQVDPGDMLQGGQCIVSIRVPWVHVNNPNNAGVWNQTWDQLSIRGDSPTNAEVRARLGEITCQVTAYRESRFKQFKDGLPLYGPPNGFGIMQLDNPPATSRQLWDWKQNCDGGVSLFKQKALEAKTYPARVRKQYPKAKDFTPEQLRLETYQRYNGGAYWEWDNGKRQWVKSPPNDYADESVRIEELVISGRPPADW